MRRCSSMPYMSAERDMRPAFIALVVFTSSPITSAAAFSLMHDRMSMATWNIA